MIMFIEDIQKAFGVNTPIFTDDIVALFKNFTRAYVFRLIKKSEEAGELVLFSRGVYFIPKKTFFGQSTICSEMVAEKKYLKNNQSVYGVYAGLNLLNQFGLTTQVPNTIEIVTNNETTRKRNVIINGREFILRKARCEINNENYATYTIMQLFSDMSNDDVLDDLSKTQIHNYMSDNKIKVDDLFYMSRVFPASTLKKIVKSGVLNAVV